MAPVTITSEEISAVISGYLWPFFRIAALFSIAPIIATRIVPMRLRLGLALAVTAIVAPLLAPPPAVDPLSPAGLVVTVNQVLIGLTIGFVMRMVFGALETGGHIIGQTMGLGFAQMMDPTNGITVPVVSQFYTLVATLIFLALNGHLVLIDVLVESFATMPVTAQSFPAEGLWAMLEWAGWIFKGAVLIALPVVTALLLVNIAFGVMMRAAPQLNIFVIGFPISLMLGFLFMLVALPVFIPQFDRLLESAYTTIGTIVNG